MDSGRIKRAVDDLELGTPPLISLTINVATYVTWLFSFYPYGTLEKKGCSLLLTCIPFVYRLHSLV